VLGFTLPENFRTPYRSANLQEFWRRWHISLSTWLRDYLYISLGGSQGAPWRTYLNLILTMLLGGLWHGASWTFVVWGALHGGGLAVTRYFQRHTGGASGDDARAAMRMLAVCGAIAVVGVAIHRVALSDAGSWTQLGVTWLYLTPLWAVLTAWLSREQPAQVAPMVLVADEGLPWRALFRRDPAQPDAPVLRTRRPELLRLAMCLVAVGFLAALMWAPSWTWIPLVVVTWALGLAADAVERGAAALRAQLVVYVRRAVSVVLVFQYVCVAWIFFRATSFDNALAVLREIGQLETDHANLVPIVTVALTAGFACHLFGDASFRWLRRRFVGLPPWAQGLLLAGVTLVLRELGHTKIVPFIYFQF
jgi:D-alanyl-lipoteichoic acid acyltransferase DltB (MBOAT superfamily)